MTPGEGGVLLSADGRVQVDARPGAVSAPTLLRYRPHESDPDQPANLDFLFGFERHGDVGTAGDAVCGGLTLRYRDPAAGDSKRPWPRARRCSSRVQPTGAGWCCQRAWIRSKDN
ncbi:hypothetical protein [Candidatus Amarobacter glycogenicus]|uniref:hypothetical protein n=1 Tax=Candidatus Amarobacter glycogenicus TaxID=3140699 RepID=UPI0031349D6C|nr:hypothetical protein [Dehalococcoidia bacterium]